MGHTHSRAPRTPSRFHISRASGQIALSEVLPGIPPNAAGQPLIASPEAVPFRLTPNMQHFIGPMGTEGIIVAGLVAMGRCLTDPEVHIFSSLAVVWMTDTK